LSGPPPAWLRAGLFAVGAFLCLFAASLYLAPSSVADPWPWTLTPLTARVLAAWFGGLGLVFAMGAWSNDRMRMRAPVAGLAAFGVLQGLALARSGSDASGAALGVWIAFVVACTIVGGVGLRSVWADDPAGLGAA
jgi:hypothetical protein